MKVGIIGQGFVGSAIREGLKNFHDVKAYDIESSKCFNLVSKHAERHTELVHWSDIIFVCLPTPMRKNGSCDTRILETAIKKINETACSDPNRNRPILVVKSTVPPGTTARMDKLASVLNVCFSPEFLTEANAVEDFSNQNRIILGGPRPATTELRRLYSKVFPKAHIIKTDSTHAEMVKYLTNSFLATKVSFANEIYQVCEKLNIDYDKVVEYATLDDRLGKSHWNVPGPDGDFGFGGHCLPKDLSALIYLAMNLDTETNVLNAVEETNDVVRTNRDWENMKGRAVV